VRDDTSERILAAIQRDGREHRIKLCELNLELAREVQQLRDELAAAARAEADEWRERGPALPDAVTRAAEAEAQLLILPQRERET